MKRTHDSFMMAQGKAVANVERLRRSMNMKTNIDLTNITFTLPGFKYDDFDRSGFVNLAKVNRLLESSPRINVEAGITDLPKETLYVVFSTHIQATKQLYRNAAIDYSMKFDTYLSKVGKSSFDAVSLLVEEEKNIVLAHRIARIVSIDRHTRKTIPIPDNVRKALFQRISDANKVNSLPDFDVPVSIPERHFVHDVTVRFSDMDILFHTNQGSYLFYAFECAAQAAVEGFYSKIHRDICFYPAKMASGLHLAETHAGDALKVLTWEDEKNPMFLHFIVKKKDKNVYYAKVEFFSPEEFNISML